MSSLPDFQTNPFYILNAIPADSSTTLSLRAAKPASDFTIEQANAALKKLLNPQDRLKAEIAWLPGVSREQTRNILQIASLSPGQIISGADLGLYSDTPLSPLAKCNIVAWKMEILANQPENSLRDNLRETANYKDFIVSLLETFIEESDFFGKFQQERIFELINQDRRQAYFPQLPSVELLEKPLAEQIKYYLRTIINFFEQFYPQDIVEILNRIVMRVTRSGRRKPPLLLQLLINNYERHLQTFLLLENGNINAILARMQIENNDKNLQAQWDMLIPVMKNWLNVTEPVYLCASAKGLSYYPILMQYNRLRNAAWSMAEDKDFIREEILKFLESHAQFPQCR